MHSHQARGEGSLLGADDIGLLEVKAFGRLRLSSNGKLISSFPTRKVEELLAYLLLNLDVDHEREKLTDLLWPDIVNDNGRSRLSTTLWRIRVLLRSVNVPPEGFLVSTTESVSLKSRPDLQCDVNLFQDCVAEAKLARRPEDKEPCLQAARAIYRAELLEGLYNDWCLIERERLARMNLRSLGQLMACYLHQGAIEKAIEVGHEILDADPLREEVHRALINCYGSIGRRSDAVRQFQRCANLLLQELGIFPLPETIQAYQTIVAVGTRECLESSSDLEHVTLLQSTFGEFERLGSELIELMDSIPRPEPL